MIYNYDLETHLLSGLCKYPDTFSDIRGIISEEDFFSETSKINRTIFTVLSHLIDTGVSIDEVIISQRIKDLRITFEESINPSDYVSALFFRKIAKDSIISVAQELKKITIRRLIFYNCAEIGKKMRSIPTSEPYHVIVETADKIYNQQINLFEAGSQKPENIFEDMEMEIETLGNNPIEEFGLSGPHPKLQAIYGSLVKPGNITVIVARSGVGKSSLAMDFCSKVGAEHNIPVLHFDNGEMSKQELIHRQCAAMSGVPIYLIETGNWRKAGKEVVDKVRSVWGKIKNLKFYYYNVGGTNVDDQINLLKRFYFSSVGRGNPLLFSFDYIKTTNESSSKQEWQVVGELVDKYKQCIQKQLVFDNKPTVSMFTSVQANRSGIVNNRLSANVVDDESIVSLSDRITHFSSHLFIMRENTLDELETYPGLGTHRLINVKKRHLGKDIDGALNPVKMPDGTFKKNFINFDIKNFSVTEVGDLRDIVKKMSDSALASETNSDLPKI